MTEWRLPLKSGRGFVKRAALVTPKATVFGVVLMAAEGRTFDEVRQGPAHVQDAREPLDLNIGRTLHHPRKALTA